MKFTQNVVAAARCPEGRKDALIFDGTLPGFGLRLTSTGSKYFLVQYRTASGSRRMTLGRFGALTVDQARKLAQTALGEAAAGRDPLQAKRAAGHAEVAAHAAARSAITFEKLTENWLKAHQTERRPSYLSSVAGSLRRNFSSLLKQKADAITVQDVVSVLDLIVDEVGPIAANRGLSYGRAVYGWAVKRRSLKENPFAGLKAPSRENSRERVLTDDELGVIWRATSKVKWPGGPFVRFLMCTLARRDEVAQMRWAEISGDSGTWTLPSNRSKNRKAHTVHLSEESHEILASLPRLDNSPFVFSKTGKKGVSGFSKFKIAIDNAIAAETGVSLAPWRFHDFRRSGVTWLAQAGFDPHIADRLLNHIQGSLSGVAEIYQRHEFKAERAKALEAWAKHISTSGRIEALST